MQIQILPLCSSELNLIMTKFKIRKDNGFAYEKDIPKIISLGLKCLLKLCLLGVLWFHTDSRG